MRTRHIWLVMIALGAVTLSSCDVIGQWLGLNYSEKGTITGYANAVAGTPKLQISNGSDTLSVLVKLPVAGNQNSPYSFSYVPRGTYKVVFTYKSADLSYNPTYTLNGGTPQPLTPATPFDGTYYDYTYTINNIAVDADTTLDIYLGNLG